jgi:type IV conjugative transfer system coupling protein TraD
MFKNLTLGGQTTAHGVRMLRQVLKIGVIIAFLTFMGYIIYQMYTIDHWYYRSIPNLFKAIFRWDTNAVEENDELVIALFNYAGKQIIPALKWAGGAFLGYCIFAFFKGSFTKRKKKIKSKSSVKKVRIKNPFHKGFYLGKASLPKGSENKHILISGGTGSGKTNAFFHLLNQVRDKKQKAVVMDSTGVFTKRYFKKDRDFILNPFDSRGKSWHPWIECAESFDYEAMAKSFIPILKSEHDSYWKEAAASVFCALLEKKKDKQDLDTLLNVLLKNSLADLSEALEETEGRAHIDPKSDKAAASIRSVLATQIKCLKYIKKTEKVFSIKKWMKDPKQDSFLFLSCKTEEREALKPLISAWYSTAIRALMRLEPSEKRRIWFVNDELPSMDKITGLETCLAEGRKYGACSLIAVQSPSQIEELYGRCGAKTIAANCNTKIVFKEAEPVNAKQLSLLFGEEEIQETHEGLSYGAHQMRDGVNQSKVHRNRPVISATDIQNLKPHHCFLRKEGKIEKIKLKLAKKK